MKVLDVDVLLLGYGLHNAVVADRVLRNRSDLKILAVDTNLKPGGCLAPLATIVGNVSLVPMIERARNTAFQADVIVLKEGDFDSKFAGFEDPTAFQRLWFRDWIKVFESGAVNVELNPLANFVKNLAPKVLSNVSAISLSRKTVKLSNGMVIKYRVAVSSWPLDVLIGKIIDAPRECIELRSELRTVSTHATLLIEALKNEVSGYAKLYIHGTKASRAHTFLKLFLGSYAVVYAYTSFSKRYPALPGTTEKLFSELKKFRIVDMSRVVDERHGIVYYSAISKLDEGLLSRCSSLLEENNLVLCERLGYWRDAEIRSIVSAAEVRYRKLLKMLAL